MLNIYLFGQGWLISGVNGAVNIPVSWSVWDRDPMPLKCRLGLRFFGFCNEGGNRFFLQEFEVTPLLFGRDPFW